MDPADAAQSSGSFLTPLLFSLAGIVATSLALAAYHLILVKYCVRNRYDQEEDVRNSSIPTQHGGFVATSGVEHKILETIPILSFSRQKVKDQINQTECVICLGELEEEDEVRLLPNCKHVFHVQCIDNWFLAHSSCPVCRTPVVIVTTELAVVASQTGDDGSGERVIQDLAQSSQQERDVLQAASISGAQSNANANANTLLRHCVSMVFPRETKPKHLTPELKRSLSMDQSYVVLINLADHDHSGKEASSSNTNSCSRILTKSNSLKVQSMRQLDRMSSSLLRSFSQLRTGRSSTTYGILPY